MLPQPFPVVKIKSQKNMISPETLWKSFKNSFTEKQGKGKGYEKLAQTFCKQIKEKLILFLMKCTYIQFSSVAQSCLTLCNPMNHSMPGLPVHHQLPESTQTHVHRVDDAIQPSHHLSSPSPPALTLSQHQGLFKWVSSSCQVAKVLEFQLQHQTFQKTPRADLH